MSGRLSPLVTGNYYHVFNRGVAKQTTFIVRSDYERAMLTLEYYKSANPPIKLSRFKELSPDNRSKLTDRLIYVNKNLVDIVCFVLMPNHFHFLLKQKIDGGISKYLSLFTNSYTRYFNTKNNRVGPMFQGAFKAVEIESQEQLIHISRYIHLNPYVASVVKKAGLINYSWSSLPMYFSNKNSVISTKEILVHFSERHAYKDFVFDHSDYARELELVKHQTLDIDD